ncbi:MAG: winged helix-turn-helix domain-containing protein [Xanthomonadales bacterium]|nr:winged helix-turn-helix domain-containing protein [Xanthomonadales bacterium]
MTDICRGERIGWPFRNQGTSLPINSDADITSHYAFGGWRFDAATGDLSDGDVQVRLEPQVAKLLAFFLGNQDRVLSLDELIAAVWDNRVVSNDAIHRCVSILRQTLSPGDTHAYIETVTRRGYVAHFPPAPDDVPTEMAKPSNRRYWLPAAVLAIVIAIGSVYFIRESEVREQPSQLEQGGPPVVAVLPFTNFGEESDGELFANGVHDDLLTQLAQLQALRVISRTSVAEYGGSNKNMREIGMELGADAIVEGSVQSRGDQIRINVQLIDVESDEHLWAQTYDRELSAESLFAIQTEIARSIAAAMHIELTTQETSQVNALPTQNMAAYRAYRKAMEIRDRPGIYDPEYIEELERAVSLDPTFVRAWAELAGFLSLQNFSQQDAESIARLEGILENIQSLAPDSAESLIARAYYTYYVVKNYEMAHELFNRAQQLRPSDVRIVEVKSYVERRLGDFDGRVESMRLAQRLDPRNPHWTHVAVLTLMAAHRYEDALEEIASSLFDDYTLSVMRAVLDVRDHRNFERWLAEVTALQSEFADTANPLDLWDAQVANRDFEAARALHEVMPETVEVRFNTIVDLISEHDLRGLLNAWFLRDEKAISDYVSILNEAIIETSATARRSQIRHVMLAEALQSAVGGNPGETERLIRQWFRASRNDLAELTNSRHFACRVLGMAAATAAAVDCLRQGLVEPSYVIPFIEPDLPYYDSIRDEPSFSELTAQ